LARSPAVRLLRVDSLTGRELFFVFGVSPLFVAYTRGPRGIEVMYFTPGPGDRLLWTNSARITMADRVFKRGLAEAASEPEPFASLRIPESSGAGGGLR